MKAKWTRFALLAALFIYTKTLVGQQINPAPPPPVKLEAPAVVDDQIIIIRSDGKNNLSPLNELDQQKLRELDMSQIKELTILARPDDLDAPSDVVAEPPSKKIVITKTIRDAAGNPTTETIVKEGPVAENFDVKKWIDENRGVNTEIVVKQSSEAEPERIFKFRKAGHDCEKRCLTICDGDEKDKGFLGVEPADDAEKVAGLPIEIIENSAAAEAGLKKGDVILKLDDSNIENWDDLTRFMNNSKAGQSVKITLLRDGKTNEKTAVLKENQRRRSFAWAGDEPRWTCKPTFKTLDLPKKEACLGVFGQTSDDRQHKFYDDKTAAEQDGSKITSFVTDGAAEKAGLKVGDLITAIDNTPTTTFSSLYKTIGEYKPGDKVKVSFERDGQKRSLEVVLQACEPRPEKQRVIVVKPTQSVENQAVVPKPTAENRLALESFQAFPNPTNGVFTVRFRGAAVPTVVRLFDVTGKVVFNEELNTFDGAYEQPFDLSESAKGTFVIAISQGEKVFTEQILVN